MNCSGTAFQLKFNMPDAQWGRTNGNIRVWSRERFMAGPSKKNGWFTLKRPELLDALGASIFKGKIWSEGCRVCDSLLIGWWWGNRDLMLSLKLPSFTWVEAPAKELTDINMHIPWRGAGTLLHSCNIVSWLSFLCFCFITCVFHHFPVLTDNCSNLPFGTQGTSSNKKMKTEPGAGWAQISVLLRLKAFGRDLS